MTTEETQERIFMCLCPYSSKGIVQEELNEFFELKKNWAQILFIYCKKYDIKEELDISNVKIELSPDNFKGKNVKTPKDFVETFKKILKNYSKKYPKINKETKIYWKNRNDNSNKGDFYINKVKISFEPRDYKIGYCDGYLIKKLDSYGIKYLQCTINSEHIVKDDTFELLKSKINELEAEDVPPGRNESSIFTPNNEIESFKRWWEKRNVSIKRILRGFTINFWKIFKKLLQDDPNQQLFKIEIVENNKPSKQLLDFCKKRNVSDVLIEKLQNLKGEKKKKKFFAKFQNFYAILKDNRDIIDEL